MTFLDYEARKHTHTKSLVKVVGDTIFLNSDIN